MSKCLSTLVCALFTVSLLASGAQAATVFEKDGFTYKIKGDLQLQLRQAVGNDEELEVNYDDLELKNALSYDLGNDLTAFGELDFGFKDNAEDDGSPELEEAYLGFAYNSASILFGKTDSAADEFGIEGTIEGNECEVTAFPADNGDDLIRAEAEFEMATIVVTHELEAEGKDSQNGSFTDIFAGFEFAGFELGAAYQTYEENPDSDSIDTYGVSLGYDAEFIYVAADYSYGDYNTDELTVWNVFASAPVAETVTIGAGYTSEEYDVDEDIAGWYANVVYKFPEQSNVRLFAEVADDDGENHDMGFLAGVRMKF